MAAGIEALATRMRACRPPHPPTHHPRMTALLRRHLLATAALLATGAWHPARAADIDPSRPIRILVGYSAGGAVDAIARSVGQRLATQLGQPVVVENKPGAGTNIAVKALIASPPDGHTLLLAANALAVNPSLFQPAPYDLDARCDADGGGRPGAGGVRRARGWAHQQPGRPGGGGQGQAGQRRASRRRATARRRTWRWNCSSTPPASS